MPVLCPFPPPPGFPQAPSAPPNRTAGCCLEKPPATRPREPSSQARARRAVGFGWPVVDLCPWSCAHPLSFNGFRVHTLAGLGCHCVLGEEQGKEVLTSTQATRSHRLQQ